MDREEILAKSREEHKDQDLYRMELEAKAGGIGMLAATAMATAFLVLQLVLGKGINTGLYAILFSVGAAQFITKAIYLRQKREAALAVLYTALALALSAFYIYSLLR